jgi:hypothetical protein
VRSITATSESFLGNKNCNVFSTTFDLQKRHPAVEKLCFGWHARPNGCSFSRMTYLSTQATAIQSITRNLNSALLTHLDAVARKAGELLFPTGVPPGLDMRAVCLGFTGLLQSSADEVADRDREVARERSEDDAARVKRDEAVGNARGGLFSVRDAASGAFGEGVLSSIGLSGRIPEQAEPLLTFTRNAATSLPALATRPFIKPFVQLDVFGAAAELTLLADLLAGALTDVARDMRETQMAQSQRNEAVDRWRQNYSMVANLIEGLLRAAGFHHVADRVRPTRRRRAGETEPEDTLEPPIGDAPAGVVVTPDPAPTDPAE